MNSAELRDRTLCVQCGPGVAVDEDGCCGACGAQAFGPWADKAAAALERLESAERERDEARATLREASAFASAMRLAFDRSDSRHAECVHAARRYMDAAAPQTPSEGGTP